jgi:uncharacterized membrane protein
MRSEPLRPAFGGNDKHKRLFVDAIIFVAAIGSGIVGGIFYAFSSFVMAALARIPAAQGAAAMNSISVTVINPSFMIAFMGTGIVCLIAGGSSLFRWSQPGAKWALTASIVCLVGCIGVTMAFNVPLNDKLASLADTPQAAGFWSQYLASWNPWNHVLSMAGVTVEGRRTLCQKIWL